MKKIILLALVASCYFYADAQSPLTSCPPCPSQWSKAGEPNMIWADCARWCGKLREEDKNDWRMPALIDAIQLSRVSNPAWDSIWTSTPPGFMGIVPAGTGGTPTMASYYTFAFVNGSWSPIRITRRQSCRCVR